MEFEVYAVDPRWREAVPPVYFTLGAAGAGSVGVTTFLTVEQARELALKLMAKAIEVEA